MENLEIGQLKKISELNNESFYIPAYQRGYKWDSVQVQELLDDIDVQRRYLAPCEMRLVAVNKKANEQFTIETFEVCYEE